MKNEQDNCELHLFYRNTILNTKYFLVFVLILM